MGRVLNSSPTTSEAAIPFAYTIDSIELSNHNGRTVDISSLVPEFSLTESIYRPYVSAQFSVRDSVNLLEQFQLSGQEKIKVSLSRSDNGSNETIRLSKTFYVTEYPVYAKMPNRVQAFVIKAIAEHAFLSRFKRISRAIDGNVLDLVKTILVDDLKYDADKIVISSTAKAQNIKCIVPNLTPLDAIGWLLRRAFDTKGAPFYCFETLDGTIHIKSQTDLVSSDNAPIREYVDGPFYTNDSDTAKNYQDQQQRIVTIASDVKLSKFLPGARGAFGSTTRQVNLAEKTYKEDVFDYSVEFEKMAKMSIDDSNTFKTGKSVVSPTFTLGKDEKPLTSYGSARINTIAINSLVTDGYHSAIVGNALSKVQSHVENLDTFVHDIGVAGDLNMHAGAAVSLKLTKPLDPAVEVQNDKTDGNISYDEYMSGKHIITAAIHRFSDMYTCEIRVKRDSMNQDFS